eukprot:6183105-Pleurochrysis_carterae.AAC.1
MTRWCEHANRASVPNQPQPLRNCFTSCLFAFARVPCDVSRAGFEQVGPPDIIAAKHQGCVKERTELATIA